jgi:hypothetical protein
MREVYTCTCGCQTWVMHADTIECSSCKTIYEHPNLEPAAFNMSIREVEERR